WSKEEDARLCAAVEEYGMEWAKVAKMFPGRSQNSCRSRWYFSTASTIKRGYWTSEEDALLAEAVNAYPYVAEYGFLWTTIARHMGSRTPTQCRDRWRSSMTPGIKSGHWTEEEDELLRQGVKQYNRRWKMVASMIPGRTPRQCSARWNAAIDPT
ncbi:Homeodomain-like protein, partial [Syncephalis plumigaleata]